MIKDPELAELEKIFSEMDKDGKEKLITAATMLLNIQKTLENKPSMIRNNDEAEIEEKSVKTLLPGRKIRTRRIAGYSIIGLLLIITACFFWVTSIIPALQINNNNLMLMIRISVTAIFGFFCIGMGIMLFLLRKITFIWVFLTVTAGILCAIPDVAFDFIGLIMIALIGFSQLIRVKQNKTREAI